MMKHYPQNEKIEPPSVGSTRVERGLSGSANKNTFSGGEKWADKRRPRSFTESCMHSEYFTRLEAEDVTYGGGEVVATASENTLGATGRSPGHGGLLRGSKDSQKGALERWWARWMPHHSTTRAFTVTHSQSWKRTCSWNCMERWAALCMACCSYILIFALSKPVGPRTHIVSKKYIVTQQFFGSLSTVSLQTPYSHHQGSPARRPRLPFRHTHPLCCPFAVPSELGSLSELGPPPRQTLCSHDAQTSPCMRGPSGCGTLRLGSGQPSSYILTGSFHLNGIRFCFLIAF
jgi:hypothetical protein